MTFEQLQKALENNNYILLRTHWGLVLAVNCKAKRLMINRYKFNPKTKSSFISFTPCSFSEYISNKTPFL